MCNVWVLVIQLFALREIKMFGDIHPFTRDEKFKPLFQISKDYKEGEVNRECRDFVPVSNITNIWSFLVNRLLLFNQTRSIALTSMLTT